MYNICICIIYILYVLVYYMLYMVPGTCSQTSVSWPSMSIHIYSKKKNICIYTNIAGADARGRCFSCHIPISQLILFYFQSSLILLVNAVTLAPWLHTPCTYSMYIHTHTHTHTHTYVAGGDARGRCYSCHIPIS